MTEAASIFNQEVSERAKIGRSAHHKANGSSVAKLGNKRMSWQEIASKHGECKDYDLGGFLTFSEFEKCPADLKVEYINKLMDKYDIELQHISMYLFHKGADGLKAHLRNVKMKGDRALKFCDYQKSRAKTELLQFQADIEEWKRREATAKEIDEMEAQRKREIIWNAEFITFEEFKTLSLDGQIKYCNNLEKKYEVGLSTISIILFEKSRYFLRDYFFNRKVSEQIAKAKHRGPSANTFNETFQIEVNKWKGIDVKSEPVTENTEISKDIFQSDPDEVKKFIDGTTAQLNAIVEEKGVGMELDRDISTENEPKVDDEGEDASDDNSDCQDMDATFYRAETYERWKTRKKSLLIKLMFNRGKGLKEVAQYIGCTESYFNTKLARNSWSFEDLVTIAHAEGLHFGLLNDDGELQFSIKFEDWFRDYDEKVLENVHEVERKIAESNRIREEKKAEYEQLKANVAELKARMAELNNEFVFERE